ncbi:metal ABC transporter substrate-binding protein [Kushneria indalinina]|uniref:ABC-type Zn uptake system ZnuABC Zn-binding protein ZnuA n=1 Tax=Kushneria indalinina DSM 14324 TaxID=1122140 RepID=A0A3D9DU05_9GAMM|nr:metal ABC transporter substrate-binding protein [Kushneria indalinina]REC94207.1 ABC-type Zn uptake system ZnuABC Zn-binding protein ZnuA [Kushneria indalinina DSM 14324]
MRSGVATTIISRFRYRMSSARAVPVWALLALLSMPGTVQAQERKTVVASFTIMADMARQVAGEALDVVSIVPPGAEIHEYAPTPRDILKARRADLILYNGMGLERWFQRFYQGMDNVPTAVLTEGIEPIGLSEGPYQGRPNPHAWMTPGNGLIYVENIRQALVSLDPGQAETYNRNAKAYSERLETLDRELGDTFARIPDEQRTLATCEGAFSYLTRAYDFRERYLWAVNAEQEGTPQQVRRLIDHLNADDIPVTFCESTVNDRAMKQVTAETGARYGGTLYVDSLTRSDGVVPDYETLLRYNALQIQKGFDLE